jgi:hypothetical protein
VFRSYFGLFSLSCGLFLGACSARDDVPSKLTFSLEGSPKDFSKSISVTKSWVTDSIEIEGISAEGEALKLSLKKVGTGSFTQADYDPGAGLTAPQYQLRYTDAKKNTYAFQPETQTSFKIDISSFDNSEGGEVSGSFSGVLGGSILNGSGTPTTIAITEGVFSHGLEAEID